MVQAEPTAAIKLLEVDADVRKVGGSWHELIWTGTHNREARELPSYFLTTRQGTTALEGFQHVSRLAAKSFAHVPGEPGFSQPS